MSFANKTPEIENTARGGSSPHEFHDVFHVVRVGEHIDGLHRFDAVVGVEQRQVAGLRGGVAAHVDDPPGRGAQEDFDHRFIDARTRRIENHDIGTAVRGHERIVEHRLHVPGVEARVADAVQLGVDLRVGDGLGDILDAHHPVAARGAEVGDGARAGVEVVKRLAGLQVREIAGHLVEFVSLRGVGLIERLGPDLEAQPLHLLDDMVLAAVADRIEIADRVVEFGVDYIE